MDDMQRKKIQMQLMVFCAFGFPCALVSFIMYNSIQVLVFTGIASFMLAGISSDVLDYCKGEEVLQSHPEAGSGSSRDYASGYFYQQDDINNQNRLAKNFINSYEQDQLREVQPEHSAKSHRTVQSQRPASPRRTVQLQVPPERSEQPQHPVTPRRSAQLQRPVPPRRSAHTRSTQP
jgi:hypothetical protein